MPKRSVRLYPRGYFGIGVYRPKMATNIGTLFRSAVSFGAAFIFVIGRRFPRQASDTGRSWKQIPAYEFDDFDHFLATRPFDAPLIGIEIDDQAAPLFNFEHPEQAVYLLGSEDSGLPERVRKCCQGLVIIPAARWCLNVATAGSIVLYDRAYKQRSKPSNVTVKTRYFPAQPLKEVQS